MASPWGVQDDDRDVRVGLGHPERAHQGNRRRMLSALPAWGRASVIRSRRSATEYSIAVKVSGDAASPHPALPFRLPLSETTSLAGPCCCRVDLLRVGATHTRHPPAHLRTRIRAEHEGSGAGRIRRWKSGALGTLPRAFPAAGDGRPEELTVLATQTLRGPRLNAATTPLEGRTRAAWPFTDDHPDDDSQSSAQN